MEKRKCWARNRCVNPNLCCHDCKVLNCEMRCLDDVSVCKYLITEKPIVKVSEEIQEEAYSIMEISLMLNRTYDEIYNMVYYKQIEFYKKGRTYQIPKSQLDKIKSLLK